MHIVQEGKDYKSQRYYYVIFKSKTGLKRDYWTQIESGSSLDDIANYFIRLEKYDKAFKDKFKYKVMLRHIITKDDLVSPQDIMVLRMKHGF